MEKFLLIIIPFLSAMALRRLDLVREKHARWITSYVINFSLPCLTLMTISQLNLKQSNFSVAVIAWIVMALGTALGYFTGRALGLTGGKFRSFILVVTFPNTCFIGYPLTFALYGSEGLPFAVIYDQMGMVPLFLTLGFMVAGGRKSLGSAIRFPPFIALVIALMINMAGFTIAGPLATILKGAGWTTLPLTIFLIGIKVTLKAVHDYRAVAMSLLLRMVALPAILSIALAVLGLKGIPYSVALLETAMPPALTTSILALRYGLDEEFAVASISVGTFLWVFLVALLTLFR